ncbi:WD40 repeat domain-containing protein [Catellatospora aurea]|uniref:WD40 repeat domain-containing protein n=1 Tax=Catellatospora aurea TaxID=1337874 RepID=A0ABW2H6Q7_9ACTN
MTAALRDALHRVADNSPPVPVPPGLFDRARRDRLHRRLAGLAAAVALLGGVGLTVRGTVPLAPATSDTTVDPLPAHVVQAPDWTADIRHAPLRRALVAFDGDPANTVTVPREGQGVSQQLPVGPLMLVGPDDTYRTYDPARDDEPWTGVSLLSPDGRYLMTGHSEHTRLLDVTTGDSRALTAGQPLAFSPDSRQAVLVHFDNPWYLHPVRGEIRVVDLPSGAVAWTAPLADGPLPREVNAALSPDGSTLAVQRHGDLYTHRRDGGPGWSRSMSMSTLGGLAGQLAWTPDGRSIAVDVGDLCLLDADTGATGTCLQWQSMLQRMPEQVQTHGLPVVLAWQDGRPIVALPRDVVRLTEVPELIMKTPAYPSAPVGALTVATGRVDWSPRQPGPQDPGPAIHRYRPLIDGAGLVITLLTIGYAVLRLSRRHRRTAGRKPGSAGQGGPTGLDVGPTPGEERS